MHVMQTQLSREHMREYLRNPLQYECRLTISHSRVVQKSYGKERRFFCLPPTVTLDGVGWQSLCAGNAGTQWTPNEFASGIQAKISNGYAQTDQMLEFVSQNFAQAKQMTMSAEDPQSGKSDKNSKATFFDLTVTLQTQHGQLIGDFRSDRIKVISKKPKKIQSIKNTDCKTIFVASGSTVSCKTKTLYMNSDNSGFVGSADRWSSLGIYLIDENTGGFQDGFVNFEQVVELVDRKNGFKHPRVRIRRIEGNGKMKVVKAGKEEPVCQLYKCAFQLLDQEDLYLTMRQDGVIMHYDANKDGQFSDAAIWNIASCTDTEFRFYYAFPRSDHTGNMCHTLPIVPIVAKIFVFNDLVHIEGRNFTDQMQIWIGDLAMPTTFVLNSMLRCPLPSLASLPSCFMSVAADVAHIPISLVHDNVVFGTREVLELTRELYDQLATSVVIAHRQERQ